MTFLTSQQRSATVTATAILRARGCMVASPRIARTILRDTTTTRWHSHFTRNTHTNAVVRVARAARTSAQFTAGAVLSLGAVVLAYYLVDRDGCRFAVVGVARASNTVATAVACIADYYVTLNVRPWLSSISASSLQAALAASRITKPIDAQHTTSDIPTNAQQPTAVARLAEALSGKSGDAATEDDLVAEQDLAKCHQRCANRLLSLCKRNGGVFIKLGQHLSAMILLLPNEYISTLAQLQDQCPTTKFDSVRSIITEDLGIDIDVHFSEFSPTPLGTASLAQVHLARLRDTGKEVVVKVQHPTLLERAPVDVQLVYLLSKIVKVVFPDYRLDWLVSEMKHFLPMELDFTHEKRNADQMRLKYFYNDPVLRIPEIYLASQRVVVMERMTGHKINDLAYLNASGVSPYEVSNELNRIYSVMIFKNGYIHCDPHPGNIFVESHPERRSLWNRVLAPLGLSHTPFDIILLDHGQYSKLSSAFRFAYAHMWNAIILSDEEKMLKYTKELFVEDAGLQRNAIAYHRLFASMLSGRSWDSISGSGARKNGTHRVSSTAQGDDGGYSPSSSVATTKTETESHGGGGLLATRSQEEVALLRRKVAQRAFFVSIVDILSKVHPDLIMLLKTHDLLRGVNDALLGPVPVDGGAGRSAVQAARAICVMGRCCAQTIREEAIRGILEHRDDLRRDMKRRNVDARSVSGLWDGRGAQRGDAMSKEHGYVDGGDGDRVDGGLITGMVLMICDGIYLVRQGTYWRAEKAYLAACMRLDALYVWVRLRTMQATLKRRFLSASNDH